MQLLDSRELRTWRDGLLAKGLKPSSVVRYCKSLRAALNLAASHDARIQNKSAWKVGLEALPDATVARNVILDDATVCRFINASYARDQKLGLLVHVLAESGARPSQATRLLVEDLHGGAKARLSVPRSANGGFKNRGARKHERVNVPITPALAAKLKLAAKGRPGDAPLLLQADGQPWGDRPSEHYREDIAEIVQGLGLGPRRRFTRCGLSIVRQLLRGVPIRIIAQRTTRRAAIEATQNTSPTTATTYLARRCSITGRPAATTSFRSPDADHGGSRHHDHTCKPRMGFAERGLSSRAGAKRVAGSRQDRHRYRVPEQSTALALYVARVQGAA
jgi:hypothetical protein